MSSRPRPNRTAAARRQQASRAHARALQHTVEHLQLLSGHRGSQPSRTGLAMLAALDRPQLPQSTPQLSQGDDDSTQQLVHFQQKISSLERILAVQNHMMRDIFQRLTSLDSHLAVLSAAQSAVQAEEHFDLADLVDPATLQRIQAIQTRSRNDTDAVNHQEAQLLTGLDNLVAEATFHRTELSSVSDSMASAAHSDDPKAEAQDTSVRITVRDLNTATEQVYSIGAKTPLGRLLTRHRTDMGLPDTACFTTQPPDANIIKGTDTADSLGLEDGATINVIALQSFDLEAEIYAEELRHA